MHTNYFFQFQDNKLTEIEPQAFSSLANLAHLDDSDTVVRDDEAHLNRANLPLETFLHPWPKNIPT